MASTLLDLNSHIGIVLEVSAQPDRREVSPSELLDDDIPVDENLTE